MSLTILESDEAINDVIDAADYISQQANLNSSDRFLQAVKDTYRRLAEMPRLGPVRDYGQPAFHGMRQWHVTKFSKYLIFYLTTETELRILRVLHGARDIAAIFVPPEE